MNSTYEVIHGRRNPESGRNGSAGADLGRVSVPVYMARPYSRTQEGLVGRVPEAMLDRNPPRFATLTQQGVSYGYESQEDSIARAQRSMKYIAAYHKEQGTTGLASQTLYG